MNSNARKNIIYSLVLLALVLLVYAYRSRDRKLVDESLLQPETGKVSFTGKTMGTDYQVTYIDPKNRNFQSSIDSLLLTITQSISTYEPNSEVNQLNLRDTLLSPSRTFLDVLAQANNLYTLTSGALDPTQVPIDKIWTFSTSGPKLQDSTDVGKVLSTVGLKKIIPTDTLIRKSSIGAMLDFSKTGKGYALDLIARFLEKRGIGDYLLQIGGENRAKGVNEKDELWKIGVIHLGDSIGQKAEGIIAVRDRAISTVGSMDQYYTRDSIRVSFTLDPRTGYPVTHGLLSATVLGSDALTADALADALMVMGWREAIRIDSARTDVEMLLLFNEKGGKVKQYISPDLIPYLSFPVK